MYPDLKFLFRQLAVFAPDVFFHPVWREYSCRSCEDMDVLVRKLEASTPRISNRLEGEQACQTQFICAAICRYQMDYQAGYEHAERAWEIARRFREVKWLVWAAWALCAFSLHLNEPDRAVRYLDWIQHQLVEDGCWKLGTIVWILRDSLLNGDQTSPAWEVMGGFLWRWGEPPAAIAASYNELVRDRGTIAARRFDRHPEANPLGKLVNNFFRLVKGELRLGLVETEREPESHPRYEDLYAYHAQYWQARPHEPEQVELKVLPEPIMTDGSAEIVALEKRLTGYFLGPFRLYYGQEPIREWNGARNRNLVQYLLLHHRQLVAREILMDLFWPDSDPDAARNNLNVAVHGGRSVLRTVTQEAVIVYENNHYGINPEILVWLDCEQFEARLEEARGWERATRKTKAVEAYELAIDLYQGEFMEDDPYEEWAVLQRESYRIAYLDALDRLSLIYFDWGNLSTVIYMCQRILGRDPCREDAHRRLMRCYNRKQLQYLAIRQYNTCVEALRDELDVAPSPATVQLYEEISAHNH